MTVDKSITVTATRKQMLKVYAMVLKKGRFNAENATKNFKVWFNSHTGTLEKLIIAGYVEEILLDTEKRFKLVRRLLEEEGYSGNPQKRGDRDDPTDAYDEKRSAMGFNCRRR